MLFGALGKMPQLRGAPKPGGAGEAISRGGRLLEEDWRCKNHKKPTLKPLKGVKTTKKLTKRLPPVTSGRGTGTFDIFKLAV